MIGAMALGMMWRRMIRALLVPQARAASTNSCPLIERMVERMTRAKMLLGNPKMKVSDAAEQCGYADPRYFSSCFKKYWHMTPSEYQSVAQKKD